MTATVKQVRQRLSKLVFASGYEISLCKRNKDIIEIRSGLFPITSSLIEIVESLGLELRHVAAEDGGIVARFDNIKERMK